ncbi:hypothetical protein FNV43_RR07767 [Rhamnella rubrinervis]|uniref:Ubiquitin-like domain-containing protein n=1 Tax=Rhamnella rubrinervis TaxID=2594499 RepID=A0A8K0MMG9_9ROSA|nr:hypothetical protein FNV43_RR07767 [Rhamnella rubrinervis]
MELKKMIEKDNAIGMAAEMQELHFNGEALDEDQLKLEDYNVPSHGATITVFIKFQLSVRKDGVSYPFAVHSGMTVRDLEKIVAEHFGNLSTNILFDLRGEILHPDVVLTPVKFEYSELSASFPKWWICHYEMWVGATIMELKKKIEEDIAFGLAVEKQELLFNEQALEDQLRIEDYQIPSNATVSLFTKIRLSVVRDGVSHPFVAHNGMKVRDLINRLIAPHFGMLSSQVMLELNGEIITTDMVLRTSKFDGCELDLV